MATSTIPKPTTNELPAQSVAEIAADMQQDPDVMLNWLRTKPSPVMHFEGKWVVSGEGAIAAIEHSSKDIATRCLARRGLLKEAAPASKSTKPDGKAIAPAAKTAAKPSAKKKTAAKKATTAKPTPAT